MFFSSSTRKNTNVFEDYSLLIGSNSIAFLESVRLLGDIHEQLNFLGYGYGHGWDTQNRQYTRDNQKTRMATAKIYPTTDFLKRLVFKTN